MRTLVRAATKPSAGRQRGFSFITFVIGLLLAVGTVFAFNLIMKTVRPTGQVEKTEAHFVRISDALVAYVTQNGRLPCPAAPNALDGRANPETATTACASAAGIVPWGTLGLPQDAVLDGWNRLISYRVLDGNTGLTQAEGASMVNCDLALPYGPDVLPGNGLCRTDHQNLAKQFLSGKGIVVDQAGNLNNGVAFVLISHGESGLGAYVPGGSRLAMPASAAELANTAAVGPFKQLAHSNPGTDPAAAGHFDDRLQWMRIEDLIRKSGLTARDWPQAGGAQITASTLANMDSTGAGHFNATTRPGGESFSAATTTDTGGGAIPTLSFGAGLTNNFANCAWWPTPFRIVSGGDTFALRLYIEFAVADSSRSGFPNDFGGFVTGFLPAIVAGVPTTINTSLCGNPDPVNTRDLGWDNAGVGNLPSSRFGTEYDARTNPAYSDPSSLNHVAFVQDGTRHGFNASGCSGLSNSYSFADFEQKQPDCYRGSGNTWLRDGLNRFHRLRVEVSTRQSACSDGTKITTWFIPEGTCPDGSTDPLCVAAKSLSAAFQPESPPSAVIKLERCLPASSGIHDQLYFGITASNGRASAQPAVYFRNLAASVF